MKHCIIKVRYFDLIRQLGRGFTVGEVFSLSISPAAQIKAMNPNATCIRSHLSLPKGQTKLKWSFQAEVSSKKEQTNSTLLHTCQLFWKKINWPLTNWRPLRKGRGQPDQTQFKIGSGLPTLIWLWQ